MQDTQETIKIKQASMAVKRVVMKQEIIVYSFHKDSPEHGRVQRWVGRGAVEHLILQRPEFVIEKCIQDQNHDEDQHH